MLDVKITVLSLFSDQEDGLTKAKEAFKWVMEETETIKLNSGSVHKLEPVQ